MEIKIKKLYIILYITPFSMEMRKWTLHGYRWVTSCRLPRFVYKITPTYKRDTMSILTDESRPPHWKLRKPLVWEIRRLILSPYFAVRKCLLTLKGRKHRNWKLWRQNKLLFYLPFSPLFLLRSHSHHHITLPPTIALFNINKISPIQNIQNYYLIVFV